MKAYFWVNVIFSAGLLVLFYEEQHNPRWTALDKGLAVLAALCCAAFFAEALFLSVVNFRKRFLEKRNHRKRVSAILACGPAEALTQLVGPPREGWAYMQQVFPYLYWLGDPGGLVAWIYFDNVEGVYAWDGSRWLSVPTNRVRVNPSEIRFSDCVGVGRVYFKNDETEEEAF